MRHMGLHLVPTIQQGDLSHAEAAIGAQLRASTVLSLMVVALLECRRLLAIDEPKYALSDAVANWTKVCADALMRDVTMIFPAEKQHARLWAKRAIYAMDESVEERAREKAQDLAVERLATLMDLQGRSLTEDETAWAKALARGVLATYLTALDHGVTI